MNKEFDNESVYGDSDKYVKTELKSYRDKINTSFRCKKIFDIDNTRFCF